MIPVTLLWDTRKRSVLIKWNGFFSLGWEKGKPLVKILCFRKSFSVSENRIHLPLQWFYFRETLSLVAKGRLKKVEGTLSFPDPMRNGLLYGWLSAMGPSSPERKINLTVNFLGENWVSGEGTISLKVVFRYVKRLVRFALFKKGKGSAERRSI